MAGNAWWRHQPKSHPPVRTPHSSPQPVAAAGFIADALGASTMTSDAAPVHGGLITRVKAHGGLDRWRAVTSLSAPVVDRRQPVGGQGATTECLPTPPVFIDPQSPARGIQRVRTRTVCAPGFEPGLVTVCGRGTAQRSTDAAIRRAAFPRDGRGGLGQQSGLRTSPVMRSGTTSPFP